MAMERADRPDEKRPAQDPEVEAAAADDDDDVQGHVQPSRLTPRDGGHSQAQPPA